LEVVKDKDVDGISGIAIHAYFRPEPKRSRKRPESNGGEWSIARRLCRHYRSVAPTLMVLSWIDPGIQISGVFLGRILWRVEFVDAFVSLLKLTPKLMDCFSKSVLVPTVEVYEPLKSELVASLC
jgi:hypothetical protein